MMGVRKPAGGSELPESRLTMQDVAPQAMITDGYLMIEGFWYNSAYADAQIYVGLEFENIETGETSIRQMEDELYELPSIMVSNGRIRKSVQIFLTALIA